MINLPEHTHTQHKNGPDGKTTTHTWTTPNALWKLTITHAQPARIGTKATPPEIDITDGRDITISRRYRDGVIDWREIGLLLHVLDAIGAIKLDNPIEAEVEDDEPPHCETCTCRILEAHIEDDETVVAFDPAAKPGDEPVVVARTAAGYMWRGQPKAMETLEREWATYEPKPRPPADRCTCVGECKNCRADKLGETFASWDEYEPYLIGGIKAHLVDWGIDWHAPKATFVDPFEELCANIATVMARYIRDTFDLDSLEKRDWTPPKDDPTSVDEFFTARYHPVRVRVSGAYDPPGAWLSTTRSNYGAHLSVDEVRRTILALARAAKLSDIAERIVHYNATITAAIS